MDQVLDPEAGSPGGEEEVERFFPHEIVRFAVIIALLLGGLTFLASVVPTQVGEPADPLKTPAGIEPEWYFLSVYQLLKYVPRWVGVGLSFIVFPAALLSLPFLWGPISRRRWGLPALHALAVFVLLGAIVLTLLAFLGFE